MAKGSTKRASTTSVGSSSKPKQSSSKTKSVTKSKTSRHSSSKKEPQKPVVMSEPEEHSASEAEFSDPAVSEECSIQIDKKNSTNNDTVCDTTPSTCVSHQAESPTLSEAQHCETMHKEEDDDEEEEENTHHTDLHEEESESDGKECVSCVEEVDEEDDIDEEADKTTDNKDEKCDKEKATESKDGKSDVKTDEKPAPRRVMSQIDRNAQQCPKVSAMGSCFGLPNDLPLCPALHNIVGLCCRREVGGRMPDRWNEYTDFDSVLDLAKIKSELPEQANLSGKRKVYKAPVVSSEGKTTEEGKTETENTENVSDEFVDFSVPNELMVQQMLLLPTKTFLSPVFYNQCPRGTLPFPPSAIQVQLDGSCRRKHLKAQQKAEEQNKKPKGEEDVKVKAENKEGKDSNAMDEDAKTKESEGADKVKAEETADSKTTDVKKELTDSMGRNLDSTHLIDEGKARVTAVINLCLTERHYEPAKPRCDGIEVFWIKPKATKDLPSTELMVTTFKLYALLTMKSLKHSSSRYILCKECGNGEELVQCKCQHRFIVVTHCSHGVNRTGYVICLLLMTLLNISASEAIDFFQKARGTNIGEYMAEGIKAFTKTGIPQEFYDALVKPKVFKAFATNCEKRGIDINAGGASVEIDENSNESTVGEMIPMPEKLKATLEKEGAAAKERLSRVRRNNNNTNTTNSTTTTTTTAAAATAESTATNKEGGEKAAEKATAEETTAEKKEEPVKVEEMNIEERIYSNLPSEIPYDGVVLYGPINKGYLSPEEIIIHLLSQDPTIKIADYRVICQGSMNTIVTYPKYRYKGKKRRLVSSDRLFNDIGRTEEEFLRYHYILFVLAADDHSFRKLLDLDVAIARRQPIVPHPSSFFELMFKKGTERDAESVRHATRSLRRARFDGGPNYRGLIPLPPPPMGQLPPPPGSQGFGSYPMRRGSGGNFGNNGSNNRNFNNNYRGIQDNNNFQRNSQARSFTPNSSYGNNNSWNNQMNDNNSNMGGDSYHVAKRPRNMDGGRQNMNRNDNQFSRDGPGNNNRSGEWQDRRSNDFSRPNNNNNDRNGWNSGSQNSNRGRPFQGGFRERNSFSRDQDQSYRGDFNNDNDSRTPAVLVGRSQNNRQDQWGGNQQNSRHQGMSGQMNSSYQGGNYGMSNQQGGSNNFGMSNQQGGNSNNYGMPNQQGSNAMNFGMSSQQGGNSNYGMPNLQGNPMNFNMSNQQGNTPMNFGMSTPQGTAVNNFGMSNTQGTANNFSLPNTQVANSSNFTMPTPQAGNNNYGMPNPQATNPMNFGMSNQQSSTPINFGMSNQQGTGTNSFGMSNQQTGYGSGTMPNQPNVGSNNFGMPNPQGGNNNFNMPNQLGGASNTSAMQNPQGMFGMQGMSNPQNMTGTPGMPNQTNDNQRMPNQGRRGRNNNNFNGRNNNNNNNTFNNQGGMDTQNQWNQNNMNTAMAQQTPAAVPGAAGSSVEQQAMLQMYAQYYYSFLASMSNNQNNQANASAPFADQYMQMMQQQNKKN